jgi:hypothetical protein
MGQGYLILALRTADGQPLTAGPAGDSSTGALVAPKLGSVVIAIPAASEAEFATQALASTSYLALSQPGGGSLKAGAEHGLLEGNNSRAADRGSEGHGFGPRGHPNP